MEQLQALFTGRLCLQYLHLQGREHPLVTGSAFLFFLFFQNKSGNNMTCANNCCGVDPNSVIIGGGAVLAASGISGLAPVLGLGAAVVVGGVALSMNQCPARRPCRVYFCIKSENY